MWTVEEHFKRLKHMITKTYSLFLLLCRKHCIKCVVDEFRKLLENIHQRPSTCHRYSEVAARAFSFAIRHSLRISPRFSPSSPRYHRASPRPPSRYLRDLRDLRIARPRGEDLAWRQQRSQRYGYCSDVDMVDIL